MDDETPSHDVGYSVSNLLRDIGGLLQPYKYRFLLATILRIVGDIVRLYPAYAFAQIISLLTNAGINASFDEILRLIVFSAVAHIIHVICREQAKLLGYRVAERLSLDTQIKTMQHLFRLDLTWHERENSGNKLKRMLKGGQSVDQILRIWITNLLEVGVNFIGITIIIATFDVKVSIALVIFLVFYYVISSPIIKRAVKIEDLVNIGEEQFHGLAFESVNNIRSVKVLGMSVPILSRLIDQAASVFANIRKRIFLYRLREALVSVYGRLFLTTAIGFIAWGVIQGRYDVGFLVLFVSYFEKVWENIDELLRAMQELLAAKVGFARTMTTLREPVNIDSEVGKKDFPDDWQEITVSGLTFGYRKGQSVLDNLSFTIRRGERVGIVGVSGAGKSTLFKLLLKEYEDYSGDISIGGVSLKDIRRSDFFKHTAVVLQDTEVFNFPLRDNITIANADEMKNEELLQRAVETAHVTNFLPKLHHGLDTLIGEKGVKLSGGEKQRVGIARAIFKQPQLLLLDEATSHLDLESEEKIRDSLHQFFQTVTAIVIAHRLSTIREMDRIFLIEEGEIIESGTFDYLYNKKGRFHELWEKQKF